MNTSTRYISLPIAVLMLTMLGCGGDDPPAGAPDSGPPEVDGQVDQGAEDAPADQGTDAPVADGPLDECVAGSAECVAGINSVRRCEDTAAGLRWSVAEPCAAETYCRAGVCQTPTTEQLQQAGYLEAMVDHIADSTGWIDDLGLDVAGIKQQVRQRLLSGDGGDGAFYAAAWLGVSSYPIGHLSMWSNVACGTAALSYQSVSRLGACARPYKDHFIVTFAQPGNPLGLAAGDEILSVDGLSGEDLIDELYSRPVCGTSAAAPSTRRFYAATSLLGLVRKGESMEVRSPGGNPRQVEVTKLASQLIGCRDPFGRDTSKVIEATMRPDGVGVVRLTSFTPEGGFKGQTNDEVLAEIELFKQALAKEFAKVSAAKAVIWDLRANGGGATPVGLSIIGGMPGVKDQTFIAHCKSRIYKSYPPAFYGAPYAFDYVVEVDSTFPHPDKVAVLIDGLSISAADYFAFAVAAATSVPLVGSPSAGAYGGGGGGQQVSTKPDLIVQSDPARCADANDKALEGRAVAPTHPAEYDPQLLSQGKDPILEAAINLLAP